jgi:hypothetical protein
MLKNSANLMLRCLFVQQKASKHGNYWNILRGFSLCEKTPQDEVGDLYHV